MIPAELRDVAQWLVSSADKAPISPKTGYHADVRDRNLYVTYDVAVAYAHQYGLDIGFVLTRDDPFTVIDLDEPVNDQQIARHQKILELFSTYTELSRSGRGVHIWCRGKIPRGVKRDKVELYPHDRYMICTGRMISNDPHIRDCQQVLDVLFAEMARGVVDLADLEDVDDVLTDQEIVDMAMTAVNADKFNALCSGQWQDEYPSQSEADYALMNMFCFYTRSNSQAKRLFRYSALGRREKAQREDYLNTMIKKIRAEEIPMVDFSGLSFNGQSNGKPDLHLPVETTPGVPIPDIGNAQTLTIATEKNTRISKPVEPAFTLPPGFVGEIAQYIYDTSTRPVPEVSSAAAISLCAGVLGRQFNISGTGLNQYLIMLAKTGVGKEDGPRGIERIINATRMKVPAVNSFLGPGTFASGQGMLRTLEKQPCFVSVLGEFGLTLQDISDINANERARTMRRVLLDLYTKSGQTAILYPSAYSDSTKNTLPIHAPAVTLFGESTPESFYEGLSLHHIADGLIPRFLIIEYEGDRTDRNPRAFEEPPEGLVQRFADLAEVALRMMANQSWMDVLIDSGAKDLLDSFDRECDKHIRAGGNEGIRQLWNRAHLKALRLAGLLAAADRPHEPIVQYHEAKWAIDIVTTDTLKIAGRFEKGDVGEGDSKQNADLDRIITDFIDRPINELASYGVTATMKEKRIVPAAYLQRRTSALSSFRKDRRGARDALRGAIQSAIERGRLQPVPKLQAQQIFGTSGSMFYVHK